MQTRQQILASILQEQLPHPMKIKTSMKGVAIFRNDDSFERVRAFYNPQILILAQGAKHVYLGDDVFTYSSDHYLVLPVPLPLECAASIEVGKPILGITIDVDPVAVGELLLEIDDSSSNAENLPRGIYGAAITDEILDAAIRLARVLFNPTESKILGHAILREILYRVLVGEKGEILQALAYRNRRFFQIAKVLHTIHNSYNESFDIQKLASDAGMSATTFHNSFKAVTDSSPLQYIKNIRLHKAKDLMINKGLNAHTAAYEVGYESPSQFNREYKRLFGLTPGKDTQQSEYQSAQA